MITRAEYVGFKYQKINCDVAGFDQWMMKYVAKWTFTNEVSSTCCNMKNFVLMRSSGILVLLVGWDLLRIQQGQKVEFGIELQCAWNNADKAVRRTIKRAVRWRVILLRSKFESCYIGQQKTERRSAHSRRSKGILLILKWDQILASNWFLKFVDSRRSES